MLIPDRTEFSRLTLQIERDLLAQKRFRMLTAVASATLRDHRHELRTLSARIRRVAKRNHTRLIWALAIR